ncbi:MAG: DoxX family protein, partial [Bacteroidaceae bacterium]
GASEQHIDLINELYDYCLKNEIPFYCLTSSEKEERLDWEDRTGAEYPVYVGDYLGLKTMIRSNPGLVVLKDGNIVNKVANSDIPDEYELQEDINLLPLFHGDVVSLGRLLGTLFLWFFGPLILVLMLDRFLIYRHRHKMEIAKAEEIQKEAASVEQNEITEQDKRKVISQTSEIPPTGEQKNKKN